MASTLGELFVWLDQFSERAPLDDLTAALADLDVAAGDLADFVRFGRTAYQRNLVRSGPAYHALVLCWRSGRRSPIHDHPGSSCAVRVIDGVATETIFARAAAGLIYPTRTRELPTRAVLGSQDDDIHQMSNLQPAGRDLITLHVYSPPLVVMRKYSLTDPGVTEFVDPVWEYAHGAGI